MSAMRGIVLLPERKKKTDYLPHSSDQNKATSIILLRHAFAQLHAPACMYKLLATSIFKPLYKLVKAVEVKLVEERSYKTARKSTVATEWVLIDLGTLACCIRWIIPPSADSPSFDGILKATTLRRNCNVVCLYVRHLVAL